MSAHTPAAQAAMSAVRLSCACSQCGKATQVGMSDCREHGVGVLTFGSEWAGYPVLVAFGNDEDEGPYIWRVLIDQSWISNPVENFLPAQLDIWFAEAEVEIDRRHRMQQEDFAADALEFA